MSRAPWRSCARWRGVCKRTLYEQFPGGKQQCFLATYDIVVRRAETHILNAGRCGLGAIVVAGPPERLCALVEAFAREVAAYPNAARLVLSRSRALRVTP